MKIQVFYTSDADDVEKMQNWKVVVRPISYMDRSHYYSLTRDGAIWFKEKTGIAPDEDTDNVEAAALRNLLYFRAEILCAIDREQTVDGPIYFAEYKNGTGSYERKQLPAEWVTLDGMAENMPPALLDECLAATRKLNAGALPSIPDFFNMASVTTSSVLDA